MHPVHEGRKGAQTEEGHQCWVSTTELVNGHLRAGARLAHLMLAFGFLFGLLGTHLLPELLLLRQPHFLSLKAPPVLTEGAASGHRACVADTGLPASSVPPDPDRALGLGVTLPNWAEKETEASENLSRSRSGPGASLIPKPNQVCLSLPTSHKSDRGSQLCPWEDGNERSGPSFVILQRRHSPRSPP